MFGALKKIKESWGWAKFLWEILGWLGLTAFVTYVAAAIGGAIWAVIAGVPLPIAIMAGFCVVGVGIWLAMVPLMYRALVTNPTVKAALPVGPNYEAYRHVDELEIIDAASLWCGKPPGVRGNDVYAWSAALASAVRKGELEHVHDSREYGQIKYEKDTADGRTKVKRSELQEWAKKHGYLPRFLQD